MDLWGAFQRKISFQQSLGTLYANPLDHLRHLDIVDLLNDTSLRADRPAHGTVIAEDRFCHRLNGQRLRRRAKA